MRISNRIRSRVFRTLLAILVAAVPVTLLTGCGDSDTTETQGGDRSESAQTQLWTCGMHPNVISEEPGQCPICGMNLTPVKQSTAGAGKDEGMAGMGQGSSPGEAAHEDMHDPAPDPSMAMSSSGGASVVIDPVTIQNIGVQFEPVQERLLTRSIRTAGHLDYNEELLSRINIKYSGWIERLYVNETGQRVRAGDPLLDVYSPEMVSAQEEYLLAYQNLKNLGDSEFETIARGARSLMEASRRRLRYWDVTEAQIQKLEERGEITRTLTIYAPTNGIVVERMAEMGMHVTPGMDMYRMADISTIWAFAHVYDADSPWLSPGLTAEMELPYNPGKVYHGTIDYIYPYLDQTSRDIKIRLVFPNRDLELKPQMYANIRLSAQSERPVLVIPGDSVIRSGERNVVFVALDGGKFEPREVILGMEGRDGYVQATSGVSVGEQVVTSAQFLIDSESRLQGAIQKMLDHRMMH